MKGWSSRNISMMDTELQAEGRAYEAQLDRQRAEFAHEHEAKLAHQEERGERGSWWRRFVRALRIR